VKVHSFGLVFASADEHGRTKETARRAARRMSHPLVDPRRPMSGGAGGFVGTSAAGTFHFMAAPVVSSPLLLMCLMKCLKERGEGRRCGSFSCLRGSFFFLPTQPTGRLGQLVTSSKSLEFTIGVFCRCQFFGSVQNILFCKVVVFR
jgi:hypothetical protein